MSTQEPVGSAASAARGIGPSTRTSEVLPRLREDLLAGELPPAGRLRLAALRAHYQVGLTPLREALFQLLAEGLVTMEDQRGFRVSPVSQVDLDDLTEQRVFLESHALRLSIERGDLGWESRVAAAHHLLAGNPMLDASGIALTPAWVDAHRSFHRVLVDACGSPWLLRFRDVLSDQTERYRRWSVRKEPGRDVAREHRRIVGAVIARDADRAVELLSAHYRLTAHLCAL